VKANYSFGTNLKNGTVLFSEIFSNGMQLIPDFGCSYNDLDAPDEEVTVLDYRSL
jgi:hypothetical protein